MPWEDAAKAVMLDALLGGGAVQYASLHTAYSTSGANEVTGGSPAYARKAITYGANSGGASDSSVAPTFDAPTGITFGFVGFWSAVTAGTFYGMFPLHSSANNPKLFTGESLDDVVTCIAHGFSDTDTVVVFGDNLPTGLTAGTVYYVRDATTDTFKLAATSGGAAIDLTADGSGEVQRITPITTTAQTEFTLSDSDFSANLV